MARHSAHDFVSRGAHLLDIDRPEAAIEQFERALALRPDDAFTLCYLARAFLQLNDYERALEYAQRASAADPTEEWAFRIQGAAHLGRDRRKSAYRCARTAVQLAPENAEALYMFAQCAHVLDRNEEARMIGAMLVRQNPELAYGHKVIAGVASDDNDLAAAAASYEKVLELDPTDDRAMQALAEIRNRHRKYGESVSLLRGAVHLDPNSTLRQGMLRDSMTRFAMFGQAHERRRSVAGFLAGLFAIYVAAFAVLARFVPPEALLAPFTFALPVVMLLAAPIARSRFFASQSTQLKLLYSSVRRGQAKRSALVALVALVTAYGIAAIVYRESGDPAIFLGPLGLIVMACWIYMLGVSLWLFGLFASDLLLRFGGGRARGSSRRSWAVPALTALALAALVLTEHWLALVAFIAGVVLTVMALFRRFPLAAGALLVLGGVALLFVEVPTLDSPAVQGPGLAFAMAAIGSALLAVVGIRYTSRLIQRRRVSRLLRNQ